MTNAHPTDYNLIHLQSELQRIDLLVQKEVHRWIEAGQNFDDRFRGTQNTPEDMLELMQRPPGTSWGQTIPLSDTEQNNYLTAYEEISRQSEGITEEAYQQGQTPRLLQLVLQLGLNQFEYDAFMLCLAVALDLRYERLYGFLQDDVIRKHASANLMLDLLAPLGPQRLTYLRYLADEAPLLKYRLLEKVREAGPTMPSRLRQAYQVDEAILAWLTGDYQPNQQLAYYLEKTTPQQTVTHQLLAQQRQGHIDYIVNQREPLVVVFHGLDKTQQDVTAETIALLQKKPLLKLNIAHLIEGQQPLLIALRITLRDARLIDGLPYLYGWDACLDDGAPPTVLLNELCTHPDTCIIAGENLWQARGMERERPMIWLEFNQPRYPQRQQLWHELLQQTALDEKTELDIKPADLGDLAGQFSLTSGQIRDAAATARDLAIKRKADTKTSIAIIQRADLFAAARAHSNPRLNDLAHKISSRYSWEDLVLPPDLIAILQELVATVKGRPKVLEEWGVGKKLASSSGVTVLFAGPPGTGKTMAAEVMAGELGLDLYKINLSSVVSKYIGETEKNLERIFHEAQNSNAILFFDEADSIFGKRSEVKDARDRYANLEVSYLLQRMERYDGVTILATNLRSNLDDAFTRRLQFVLDVPFPREEHRLQIWQALFPDEIPHVPDLDFEFMAKKFKLSGGNIRNIIVGSAYLAATDGDMVKMEHLLHATRRELQKMGRLVSDADLTPPKKNGSTDRERQPTMPSMTVRSKRP